MIDIEIANETDVPVSHDRLRAAATAVLVREGVTTACISLAVVGGGVIHAINRRFLDHDYPTDVISFRLNEDRSRLEGEVVASMDAAAENARTLGGTIEDELLLYVVHGVLHLLGYDDLDPSPRATMRRRERDILASLGVQAADADDGANVEPSGGSRLNIASVPSADPR